MSSTGLSQEQTKSALEVIDELMLHPIAQIFSIKVDPELDNVPDYYEKVKKPMDLGTVKSKIIDNTYNTLNEIKADVNQIWENAEIYNGRPSLEVFMADRLKKIFDKNFSTKVETKSHEDWTNEYSKCQMILSQLFRSQPGPLSQFNLTDDMEILVPERRMAHSFLTPDDVHFFSHNFKFVDDPAIIAKIIKIVNENEVGIDLSEDDHKINLSALSQKTLRLLRGIIPDSIAQQRSTTTSFSSKI